VGIADSRYFWVTVDDPSQKGPRGKAGAAAVLATIKAAA